MRYLPHTDEEIDAMLAAIGMHSLEELFEVIPEACQDCRLEGDLRLPEPLTEWELNTHMHALSGDTAAAPSYKIFFGAGSYEHCIPASVEALAGRSEFVTSYTPYQPEMSQGTLQGIFEYQTLVARLLGMEVANASLYDGATALAEAVLMAIRTTRRGKVAISRAIHPMYRRVVRTYLEPTGFELVEIDYDASGRTAKEQLQDGEGWAALALQSPNFFGCIEDSAGMRDVLTDSKTLLICAFTEPLAYGLLANPGSRGADIACGEGQSFGLPRSFGGPGLGMFACKRRFVRSMPGRLVGQTVDLEGRRGFVLTLATREQHIRREKATSNICTNNSLCALRAGIYMACLGKTGLRELARLNYDKSEYLKAELRQRGVATAFASPTFNEFVVRLTPGFRKTYEDLKQRGILAGLPLETYYPELADCYLLGVTETMTRDDMDRLVREVTS